MNIKEKWENLDPDLKPKVMLGGVLAGIVAIVVLLADPPDKAGGVKEQEDVEVTNILTAEDPRDLGMNSVINRLEEMQRQNNQVLDEMEALKREQELKDAKAKREEERRNRELQSMLSKLNKATDQLEVFKSDVARTAKDAVSTATASNQAQASKPGQPVRKANVPQQPVVTYKESPKAQDIFASEDNVVQDSYTQSALDDGTTENDVRPDIRDIFDENAVAEAAVKEKEDTFRHLPLGSVLQGVLLTGLDAPTKTTGAGNEHPVLIRIKKSAILPNKRRADFRECFVLAAGHGDLSTSRAFLRTEGISCITKDGGVIDKPLKAYAVGEDSKQGLRGRVVSKQGAIIGRSLWANFLKGWAGSFGQSNFQGIQGLELQTDDSGFRKIQDSLSDSRLADSAIRGTASAVDRLAEFYIDMADSMTPVIEIDAGRTIALVVTTGARFKVGSM